jgi:hypothetical protein
MITRLVPVRCPSDLSCTGGSAGSLWCRAAEDQCGRSFSPMPDSALCQALVRFIKRYGGKKETEETVRRIQRDEIPEISNLRCLLSLTSSGFFRTLPELFRS